MGDDLRQVLWPLTLLLVGQAGLVPRLKGLARLGLSQAAALAKHHLPLALDVGAGKQTRWAETQACSGGYLKRPGPNIN